VPLGLVRMGEMEVAFVRMGIGPTERFDGRKWGLTFWDKHCWRELTVHIIRNQPELCAYPSVYNGIHSYHVPTATGLNHTRPLFP